jgi:hypothetical protein
MKIVSTGTIKNSGPATAMETGMNAIETNGEHRYFESEISLPRHGDEVGVGELAGSSDRVDVEILAGLSSAVEGADFVGDGVVKAEHGTD